MEMAITQLTFASITAVLFILANCAARKRVSARVRYAVGVLLVAAFMLPVKIPLMQISIRTETAENAYFEQTQTESTQAGITAPALPNTAPPENVPPAPRTENLIFAIYAAGAILSLFCIFWCYCRAAKALQRCGRAPSERENRIFLEACRKQGLSRVPRLLVCPQNAIGSSLMFGFRRQTVLIAENMGEEELALILGHELTHCKRKDPLFKAVLALLGALYWFNPIIHLFIRTMINLCEESCDEKFLSGSSYESKIQYCRLLITTAAAKKQTKIFFTSFKGGSKTMKRRLENILNKKSKVVAAVLVLSVLLVTMLTSAIYFTLPPSNVKVAYLDSWDKVKEAITEQAILTSDYDVEYTYHMKNGEINVQGFANGKEFDVTGTLISRNHNGAKLIYEANDANGNYEVLYSAIELAQFKEFEKPAEETRPDITSWNHTPYLFFKNYAESHQDYKNAIILYLNPTGTDDVLVIEIFIKDNFVAEYQKNNTVIYNPDAIGKHLLWFSLWYQENSK